MKRAVIYAIQLLALAAFLGVLVALPIEIAALRASPAQPVRVGAAGLAGR